MEETMTLAVELLGGGSFENATRETRNQKGGYFTHQWLFEVY
jgi:hypothetical protein